MTDAVPKGRFTLAPGVRLMADERGGVVFQPSPLRAVRVNKTAFGLLLQCEQGCSVHESDPQAQQIFAFLDSLYQMRLLDWEPPQDVFEPFVTIIVPVYNRAREIGPCLDSLLALDYPSERREIIVVDDGSQDDTPGVVGRYDVKLIVQEKNLGQSAARNAAVRGARGEIIAFIDSDCIADSKWLRDLVAYFQDPRIALVGGYVASYFDKTWLDRYEEAKSPLNMGKSTVLCAGSDSDFYVPTCNMLVRKEAYEAAGGLDESWRVGEDVDLCWKLKKLGYRLMYVPVGRIGHKHRNRFLESFKRRFDYGTSEPALYARHGEVWKRFPLHPSGLLFLVFCCLALVTAPWLALPMAAAALAVGIMSKRAEIAEKAHLPLPVGEIGKGVLRSHFTLAYFLCFYCVRYHLLTWIVPLFLLFPATPLFPAIVLLPAAVQFHKLRPRINFALFLLFFLVEQLFYQAGVLWVSCRTLNFRCYVLRFSFPKRKSAR